MQIVTRLIIIAKTPLAGFAKTRLIPALGAEGAAQLAEKMLRHIVQQARLARQMNPCIEIELCVTPDKNHPFWIEYQHAADIHLRQQVNGDLGLRMQTALHNALQDGVQGILIGTDCPALTATALLDAVSGLTQHDAVLCPTFDGGYALLGLKQAPNELFNDIPWSTAEVCDITQQRMRQLGLSCQLLATQHDIDVENDLEFLPYILE